MDKQTLCPVCEHDLGDHVPDFCQTCGWACGMDITLYPSLNKPTSLELDEYNKRLAQAKDRWIQLQSLDKDNKDLKTIPLNQEAYQEIERQRNILQNHLRKSQNEVVTLKNYKTTTETALQKLRLEIQELERDKAEIVSERNCLDEKLNKLQKEVTTLTKEKKTAYTALEKLRVKIFEIEKNKASVPEAKKNQDNQINDLKKSNSDIKKVLDLTPNNYSSNKLNTQGNSEAVGRLVHPAQGSSLIELVFVQGGSFTMGSIIGSREEQPAHKVSVSSFYIGRYAVTQKEWMEVMKSNPSQNKGPRLPVENVSWYDAIEFCNRLSRKEGLTPCFSRNEGIVYCNWVANGYRLPTEAQWEYAARSGINARDDYHFGSDRLDAVAWFNRNSRNRTHEVGTKTPNRLGIFDMGGNVWEWCWDRFDENYYGISVTQDPLGPDNGNNRARRGGSFCDMATNCTVSYRYGNHPSNRFVNLGFRVCRIYQ